MKAIFCEECGGKNVVAPELLDNIDQQPIVCRICGNVISNEMIIPYEFTFNTADTLQFHLLFIDDEIFQQQLMKESFGKEYVVSIASSGSEGLELAKKLSPDLILLDVNMPDIDGYEVCRQLKDNKTTQHIPVIFVTARTEDADEYHGFQVGAIDYISKPLNLQALKARIAVQIRLKKLLAQYKKQQESLADSLRKISLWAENKQERLHQQKNNFMVILNNLNEIITLEDTEKRIIWANRFALEFFNTKLPDISGKHCHQLIQNSGTICKECPLSVTIDHDISKPVVIRRQQQGCPPFQQIHIPLFDDGGKLTGIAHIVTEKTAWLI